MSLLTRAESRHAIAGGVIAAAAMTAFIALAVVLLLRWSAGQAGGEAPFFTPYVFSILRFTLLQALLSTLLSLAFALPVALALARRAHFPGRIWLIRLMALPMGLPVLVGALGLIGIWGRQGAINNMLTGLGLAEPVSIYGLSGILIAHVFFNMPMAVRLMLPALQRLPAEYWRMAAGLGMNSFAVFRFVEWPALRRVLPGIAGLVLMLCATSFTLVLVLGGGPAATTLEVAIYQSLRFDFDPARAVALALLQIAVTASLLIVIARLGRPDRDSADTGRALPRRDGHGLAAKLWDTAVILAAALFLALPLGAILISGLDADLARLAASPLFRKAALTSFAIAAGAGIMSVLTALAIIRARQAIADRRRPGQLAAGFSALLAGLSSLVLLVPPVVIGTGWFLLLRPFGEVARFAPFLVAAINMLMALPLTMRVLAPALESHRARNGRLGASLGVTGLSRLWLIDLPALARPLLTALSFAMAQSLGDLGAVALFGSSDLVTLPWLVYSSLSSYRSNDADGLALLLGLFCLILTVIGTAGAGRADRARATGNG